jgi:hypothetical protein
VIDFHKVMTACIVVLPSKCLLLRFLCTLIDSTHPFSPCSLESDQGLELMLTHGIGQDDRIASVFLNNADVRAALHAAPVCT